MLSSSGQSNRSAQRSSSVGSLTHSVSGAAIVVDGDASRLEQVAGNLLTNAAKYTEPGGRVAVSLSYRDGEAVLRVHDSGIGISPELLPSIFDLFVQGHQTLDRARGGLGIGLTLVKRLVEMHGGSVAALSDGPGRGAEFVVRLPAALQEPAVVPTDVPQRRRERAVSARVLIVEDNADAAGSLMMLLQLLGLHVQVATDGLSAIAAARTFSPDVMLIDIGLPQMSGYDLAAQIRRDEQLRHTTLVALTGYGRHERPAAGVRRRIQLPSGEAARHGKVRARRGADCAGQGRGALTPPVVPARGRS
jgi:CheY-like chemotaxis protein/anti-sigma regulatory factor (Ser/Thr protein kinase)